MSLPFAAVFLILCLATHLAAQMGIASPLHQAVLIRSVHSGKYLQTHHDTKIVHANQQAYAWATQYQFQAPKHDCPSCFIIRDLSSDLMIASAPSSSFTVAEKGNTLYFAQLANGYWTIASNSVLVAVQPDGSLKATGGNPATPNDVVFELLPFDQVTVQLMDNGLYLTTTATGLAAESFKPTHYQTVPNWNYPTSQSLLDIAHGHFLSAAHNWKRSVGGSWEAFMLEYHLEDNCWTIAAAANGKYLSRSASGALQPTAENYASAAKFAVTPSSRFALRVKNGNFVRLDNSVLKVANDNVTSAVNFHIKPNRAYAGAVSLQELVTERYVSARVGGNDTLAADHAIASHWEAFILARQPDGYYRVYASVNDQMLAVQNDGTLKASAETAAGGALFELHSTMVGFYTGIYTPRIATTDFKVNGEAAPEPMAQQMGMPELYRKTYSK